MGCKILIKLVNFSDFLVELVIFITIINHFFQLLYNFCEFSFLWLDFMEWLQLYIPHFLHYNQQQQGNYWQRISYTE